MTIPPIEFLLVCSGRGLRDFELNRLNLAANLRKELRAIEDAIRQAEAEALLARWLIDQGDEMLSLRRRHQELQQSFEFKSAEVAASRALPRVSETTKELPDHGPQSANGRRNPKERIAS